MTLRVLSLSHQAAAVYKGRRRSQPTCRARGCRDRLGIPKPPPPGGGHAPRGAPSTRAARLLGRTHRPRLPGVRCPRATLCQRPPCVSRAAHHRAKRRAGVWCSLPMLGPCAQRQRYATACCAYRPTFIRCLSINPPPHCGCCRDVTLLKNEISRFSPLGRPAESRCALMKHTHTQSCESS